MNAGQMTWRRCGSTHWLPACGMLSQSTCCCCMWRNSEGRPTAKVGTRNTAPSEDGSSEQRQKVGVSDMAYGFAYVHNLDTQILALARHRAAGDKLHLPAGFKPKAMKAHGSSTTIRPDMQQSTGITVWGFIQRAAELGLCPQRAEQEWFDQCLPSMRTQAATRKRGLEQE